MLRRNLTAKDRARVSAWAARAVEAVDAPAKATPRRKASKGPTVSELSARIMQVGRYLSDESVEPPERGPALVVLAWAYLHGKVLGVVPVEEIAGRHFFAARQAAVAIVEALGDDVEEAVEFVKWAWRKEQTSTIPWRKQQGIESRMTWQKCFVAHKVVGYKVGRKG